MILVHLGVMKDTLEKFVRKVGRLYAIERIILVHLGVNKDTLEKIVRKVGKNVRIYHECEGRIVKSVPRIAVWHHEACGAMTNA